MAAARFATTRWSLVLAAGATESPARREALASLCALYWPPVFAFVRGHGHAPEAAEDLTQGFFARLIEKGDISDADREKGRFRSFLLAACRHYLANERDRASARKRGGGRPVFSIDAADAEERYARALAHTQTPEAAYERQWGLTLLAGVLDDLRDDYAATGRERVFERLKGFLTGADDAAAYPAAAADLGTSEGAVKVAVHRLRARYRAALRARVAETVSSEDAVGDEIRYLIRVLGGP